jgi:hypothetical protein
MAKLKRTQMDFLKSQNIPMSLVFDASGMSTGKYKEVMSDLGMLVAYGVTPCSESGHTIRTRAGHCAQCNTAAIAYTRRFTEPGVVYVAASKEIGLTKVGMAERSIDVRTESLNRLGYGGASDWAMIYYAKCDEAGRKELEIQNILSPYAVEITYHRDGVPVDCRELFKCLPQQAIDVFKFFIRDGSDVKRTTSDFDIQISISRIIEWHKHNNKPDFNINMIYGMKKNIDYGHTLSDKQIETLKNIISRFGV